MRILITGSEGSLMQSVIPRLIAQGHEVVGVDNFVRYGRIDREREYEFIEGDLADKGVVERVVKGVDGIIQAAARIYGVGGFHKYPADILSHDLALHQNILWAALANNVKKVCYISSSMVFERCENHPSAENDAFESRIPSTDYGLSKLVGERMSQAFQRQYGLTYAIWRPFNIITPFEKGEGEQGLSHVFADFIRMIILEGRNPLPIIGDGSQVRCFTWIDDVARGIAEFSFDPRTDNEIYNLGNPEPTTMAQLATMLYDGAQELGMIPATDEPLRFETVRDYDDDVKIRIPDVTKAKRDLGWEPTVKTAEAVRRCLEHVQSLHGVS